MFKFLHTADIHLDSPLKGLEAYADAPVEEIRSASRKAFDNLIDFAIEERVSFLLIAGDLYDGDWKDYNTGLFFVNRMGRLQRAGIRVFITAGNHDAANQTTRSMPLPDNVVLFSPVKAETMFMDTAFRVAIHGRSYPERAVSENFAAGYPAAYPGYFNIGLLHTGLTGREGHELYAPCSVDDLRGKRYDYWALGHVHRQEIVAREPWIIYPGNIQGRHIRETGAKGAVLVTVGDGGEVTAVEQREFDVLRWELYRLDLSACESIDAVFSRVRRTVESARKAADGRTLAMRLVLAGSCLVHDALVARSDCLADELRGVVAAAGQVWLEKVLLQTRHAKEASASVPGDVALTGLLASVDVLPLGNEDLVALLPELAALKNRLPSEVFEGDEPFLDDSADRIDALRRAVKDLLLSRLRHGREG